MYGDESSLNKVHHISLKSGGDKRKTSNLSIGVLKLQFLFDIKNFPTKLLVVAAISIFSGIYNFFLLERTGLYSLGINSVFQSIARCVTYFMGLGGSKFLHTFLFWGMILLINIPLAWIFGYRKIGKNFTILSIFAICISSLTSITLSSLPAEWGLKNFYIFSDPRTFNRCLTDSRINILQWNHLSVISSESGSHQFALNDSSNVALMFFYGFIFGVLNTFTSMVIYAVGGSTGGMDWIVFYLSKKRMNSTNNLFLYIGLIVTFTSYLIGTYIPYVSHTLNCTECPKYSFQNIEFNKRNFLLASNFIGPVFVATAIAAFTKRILFNFFYPNFKLINVRIFTNKYLQLRKLLLGAEFPHSFTINTAIGGYLLRRQAVFEITCFALELKTIKEHTRKIDPNCLIVATPIKSLSGNFVVRDNLN